MITSGRRLCLAFDRTYLLKGLDIVALKSGKGFIGTSFSTASLTDPTFAPSKDCPGHFLPCAPEGKSDAERCSGWDTSAPVNLEDEEQAAAATSAGDLLILLVLCVECVEWRFGWYDIDGLMVSGCAPGTVCCALRMGIRQMNQMTPRIFKFPR